MSALSELVKLARDRQQWPKADYRDVPDAVELEQAILDAEAEHADLLRVICEVRLLLLSHRSWDAAAIKNGALQHLEAEAELHGIVF